jgi:hypothetical protein
MNHEWKTPAPGLELLTPWLGKWHTEGQQLDSPLGPAAPFVDVETFEWLEGGHFMVHRLEGKLGQEPAACVELLGKDAQSQLTAQSFYGDGQTRSWRLSEAGKTLVLNGTWSKGSETFQVRYVASFEEEGNTIVGTWEQSRDGHDWQTFLEARSTKAQPLPNTSVGY